MKKDKTNTRERRDFMKKGAAAMAGLYIVPRAVLGGDGYTAPSDKLRIAGIGAGGKGRSDIASCFESGNAEIVALCDVDDRQSKASRERFPKADYYHDFREMMDKAADSIDAVTVSTPDHNHAVQAMAAMQLGKHVYVQKPLTHDIYEARKLTEAAEKYNVVTQMGNQGSSGDGVRQMIEWYNAGLIGEAHTVYCWTNRPVWPQGIPWPEKNPAVPKELDWDLWLGTAPYKEYVDHVVPFNWRGWWDYGTGALGDMACHIMEPPFRVLGLGYPSSAECSVANRYVENWGQAYFPESGPIASHITLQFEGQANGNDVEFHWMDGGIQPSRPPELGPDEVMGDGGNGVIIEGTRGKMMCSTYGRNPRLLPTSLTDAINVPQTEPRVEGGSGGHQAQWVNACIAGRGSQEFKELSSPFSIAGPLTESVLMGNLAIRSYDYREEKSNGKGYNYPGRHKILLWDGPNMEVTNFEPANQFVKRDYRNGWSLGV
ncbi:Gfo/Idh/MocA family oxidoreductase [Membranicola marinus]|uniref:Gfo/Idh/MocA family oxidoreductase n=1 Tax=Membranihabitans marinus TaxID=1227546 RepID=A0A953HQQ6_9BACT|nr:Gfo/Idh/MocA family oxidoreductase [Membranihabitans marinus]MBY5956645.1 Gfo/Idh/MocA family oxidoreductase [Membranihabitans marinus]